MNDTTKSFEVQIVNASDPLIQLKRTQNVISHKELQETKGFKFNHTLEIPFTKISDGEIIHKTAFINSKALFITNQIDVFETLENSSEKIINSIANWISEGSGWTIESIDKNYINIVKYKPLNGSSYIYLPIELENSAKGLINLQNKDNQCFMWCHIRQLNPQKSNRHRIKLIDHEYTKLILFRN